jgi:hypothetical protein
MKGASLPITWRSKHHSIFAKHRTNPVTTMAASDARIRHATREGTCSPRGGRNMSGSATYPTLMMVHV